MIRLLLVVPGNSGPCSSGYDSTAYGHALAKVVREHSLAGKVTSVRANQDALFACKKPTLFIFYTRNAEDWARRVLEIANAMRMLGDIVMQHCNVADSDTPATVGSL